MARQIQGSIFEAKALMLLKRHFPDLTSNVLGPPALVACSCDPRIRCHQQGVGACVWTSQQQHTGPLRSAAHKESPHLNLKTQQGDKQCTYTALLLLVVPWCLLPLPVLVDLESLLNRMRRVSRPTSALYSLPGQSSITQQSTTYHDTAQRSAA